MVGPRDTSMFIKTRTIVILVVLLTVVVGIVLAVEWRFVAFMTEARAIHNYHGICNSGVGQPYEDFIHQLRTMAERGDTNRLATVYAALMSAAATSTRFGWTVITIMHIETAFRRYSTRWSTMRLHLAPARAFRPAGCWGSLNMSYALQLPPRRR
jgi:hypothetical protein